jgi:hypothetical protein
MNKPLLIPRPIEVQDQMRKWFGPTLFRDHMVYPNEMQDFVELYNKSAPYKYNWKDKIVLGADRERLVNWVKHRFTLLGFEGWEVGTIKIKQQTFTTHDRFWFVNSFGFTPEGDYDPNAVGYKLILIPLQVNYSSDFEEMTKYQMFTTNQHYLLDNASVFVHDHYNQSKVLTNTKVGMDGILGLRKKTRIPDVVEKYALTNLNDLQKKQLDMWTVENVWPFVPKSALFVDTSRIMFYQDFPTGVQQKMYMTISTYRV